MRSLRTLFFAALLIVSVVYWYYGRQEATFHHDAPRLRAAECLENPTIALAVMVTDDNESEFRFGVEMAVAEANNRLNPDGSRGLLVKDATGKLAAKPIHCRYFSYNSLNEALTRARFVSRRFHYTAVLGYNTSDEAYPTSLIFNEAGLLYICPFATSTRITSHNWNTIIRVTPTVKGYMSAVLENISRLFADKQEAIRLAVFSTNTIYSEDASTLLKRYIADNKRMVSILDKTDRLIEDGQIPEGELIHEWLWIDPSEQKSMLDVFDASDKLFLIQKLSHYGFTTPGVRPEDLDIERVQKDDFNVLMQPITVATAVDTLRTLTPNIEIAYSGRYRDSTKEFTNYTHMLTIANADIILVLDYINDTSGELVKEIRESGNMQPIIGDDGIEYPYEIKEYLGDLAGEIYVISVYDDERHGGILKRKYAELKDILPADTEVLEPNYDTYQAYRSASLFAEAVAKCQSSDPMSISTRIKYGPDLGWASTSGNPLFFDSHGDITSPEFLLKKYDDGHFYLYQEKER